MKINRNWRNSPRGVEADKHDEAYSSVCQCDDCLERRLKVCGWMVHIRMSKEHGEMEISGFGKEHYFLAGCLKPICKSHGVYDDFKTDRYDTPKKEDNVCKRCLGKLTTMARLYGDEDDNHIACDDCGFCISRGDCNGFGCGSKYRNKVKK